MIKANYPTYMFSFDKDATMFNMKIVFWGQRKLGYVLKSTCAW